MSERKRARVEGSRSESSSCNHIQDLPDDLFQYCLEFVGKGNFAFVAPVSKFFYWNYISQGVQMKNNVFDVDAVLQQGRNKYTSANVIGSGSIGQATYCFLTTPQKVQHKACRLAAIEGRKDVLECAYSLDVSLPEAMKVDRQAVLEKIVTGRHLEVIKFLLLKGGIQEIDSKAFIDELLSKGYVLDVHWMVENEIIARQNAVNMKYSLAEQGHFDILKQKFRRNDRKYQRFLIKAAEGGHLEIFNWLLQRGECTWDLKLLRNAAIGGSIPILEQCLRNNCPSDASICALTMGIHSMKACDNKTKALNTLKWLRGNGIPWDAETCQTAAETGNLEALRWARTNGCTWDIEALRAAVIRGEIKTPENMLIIFKLLHQYGVPWDKSVSHAAAKYLHLPILTWVLQNGCPWDDGIYHMAMRRGDISLLKYCIVNDRVPVNRNVYVDAIEFPSNSTSIRPYAQVIQLLQLFREYDILLDESVIDCAIRLQRMNVLRWLRCNGCPCRPDQQHHLEALDN